MSLDNKEMRMSSSMSGIWVILYARKLEFIRCEQCLDIGIMEKDIQIMSTGANNFSLFFFLSSSLCLVLRK